MRPALLIATLLLTTTAFAAGAAQAQAHRMDASGALEVAGPTHGIEPGNASVARARFEYTTDAVSPLLSPSGIEVRYAVVEAPAWATVVLSRSGDVLESPAPAPGTTYRGETAFLLHVLVSEDAPVATLGRVVVEAVTEETYTTESVVARAEFAVWRAAADEACHHEEEAAAEPAPELTVQSSNASAIAAPSTLAGVGLAAVGAVGVALVLRRRLG